MGSCIHTLLRHFTRSMFSRSSEQFFFSAETVKFFISRHGAVRCVNHLELFKFMFVSFFFDDRSAAVFMNTTFPLRRETNLLGKSLAWCKKSDQNWQREEKRNRKLKQIGMLNIRLSSYCFSSPLFCTKKCPRKQFQHLS